MNDIFPPALSCKCIMSEKYNGPEVQNTLTNQKQQQNHYNKCENARPNSEREMEKVNPY